MLKWKVRKKSQKKFPHFNQVEIYYDEKEIEQARLAHMKDSATCYFMTKERGIK